MVWAVIEVEGADEPVAAEPRADAAASGGHVLIRKSRASLFCPVGEE